MNNDEELKEVLTQIKNENACKKCGTIENVYFEGMCKKCHDEEMGYTKPEEQDYINSSNSKNVVAEKFLLMSNIIHVIGYITAIIIGVIIMKEVNVLTGILTGIMIATFTWFSTLIFEAIAEVINLLQDIKNRK